MSLAKSNQLELEVVPKYTLEVVHRKPIGLLNSNYQNVVNSTLESRSLDTLYGMRQRIKVRQYVTPSMAGAVLKLAIFMTALWFMFS
ncbi:hypothetical protein OE09_0575 [Flavobacteriaceae bacterium MAR_2010_72]|nr:hypothetical protein OE09_0575 [Flavobacteriaceae bacterium MAR_2010_72]TVZ57777.1 hypothetical protein NA63_0264 [Flavobacteriaceae bacterium MAR_2010_105]